MSKPLELTIQACAMCQRRIYVRGLCKHHYDVEVREGRLKTKRLQRGPMSERLAFYSERQGDCLIWMGGTGEGGYGKIRYRGRHVGAHRVAYELQYGSIPEGLMIDHMCHNPACIEPQHLRLATPKMNAENLRGAQARNPTGYRGVSKAAGRTRYRATVKHKGKSHFAGSFGTPQEAAEAARQLRLSLFTHNDADHTHPHYFEATEPESDTE